MALYLKYSSKGMPTGPRISSTAGYARFAPSKKGYCGIHLGGRWMGFGITFVGYLTQNPFLYNSPISNNSV